MAAWYKKYKDRQALAKCCFFKYLNRKTTSSKSLRSFWSQQDGYLSKASYTNYFCKKTGIPRNEILKPYKAYIGIWAISFLTYDLAQFIFKFSHNKIFTNDRISKFNQDVDRTCYFCLKEGLSPPPSVSVQHTSYYCLMASKYIGAYQSICNINVSEKDFIFGFEGTSEKVLMINIDFFILKFIINTCLD